MSAYDHLDDTTIDALVAGDPVPAEIAALAGFAERVQALADAPPPPMSPELAALVAGGTPGAGAGRLRLVVTAGAGAAVAALALAGAAAANVLPEPVNDAVRAVVETVTPIEFEDDNGDPRPADRDTDTTVPGSTPTTAAPSLVPEPLGTTTTTTAGPTATTTPPPVTATPPPSRPAASAPPVTPAPAPDPTEPPATPPPATQPPGSEAPRPHPSHPPHPTHPTHPPHAASPTRPAPEAPGRG